MSNMNKPKLFALAAALIVVLAVAAILVARLQQSPAAINTLPSIQQQPSLQPIWESPLGTAQRYIGTVESLSPKAIILRQGELAKEFSISDAKPPRYLLGYGKLENGNYQHYKNATRKDVKKGDELQLYSISDADGTRVSRIYISRPVEEFASVSGK